MLRRISWVFCTQEIEPLPFFTLLGPHFTGKLAEKDRVLFRKWSKTIEFSPKSIQYFLKHFFENLHLQKFNSGWDNSIAHGFTARHGPELASEGLFGSQRFRKYIFLRNLFIFPGFLKFSSILLRIFGKFSSESQDHVGTKIFIRLAVVVILEHETWTDKFKSGLDSFPHLNVQSRSDEKIP